MFHIYADVPVDMVIFHSELSLPEDNSYYIPMISREIPIVDLYKPIPIKYHSTCCEKTQKMMFIQKNTGFTSGDGDGKPMKNKSAI